MLEKAQPRFHEFPGRGTASIPSVGGVRGSTQEPELAPTPKPEPTPSSGVMGSGGGACWKRHRHSLNSMTFKCWWREGSTKALEPAPTRMPELAFDLRSACHQRVEHVGMYQSHKDRLGPRERFSLVLSNRDIPHRLTHPVNRELCRFATHQPIR
jgi:hypothetical protein